MDHAYPPGTLGGGAAGKVSIALSHDESGVGITVRDDGVGAEGAGFDPTNGNSLGMSIVSGLVDDMGGRIEFRSAGGPSQRPGTLVELRVPRKSDKSDG